MGKPKYRNSSSVAERRKQQKQQRGSGYSGQNQKKRRKTAKSNKSSWWVIGGIVVLVVLVVGFFVFLSHQSGPTGGTSHVTATPVDASAFQQLTSVDPATLSQIGTGGVTNPFQKTNGSPALLKGPTGKPQVFYYGAEYCPYCAASRWSYIVALSRFGTFQNVKQITSSSTDVYPSTPTFSFYQSSYTSSYIDFVPVEVESDEGVALQNPTAEQQNLVNTYDAPPYVQAQSKGAYPFMDIGNRYLLHGAPYDPGVLRTNPQDPYSAPITQQDILSQLTTGGTISKDILGSANYITAAICSVTNNQPSSVCSDPAIQSIETTLSQLKPTALNTENSSFAATAFSSALDVRKRNSVL